MCFEKDTYNFVYLGRQLWVVKISTENQRSDLKPMVKYVANMHGNEVVGRELLLGLIEYLADSYKNGSDSEIRQLISSMDIHILVCFIYTFLSRSIIYFRMLRYTKALSFFSLVILLMGSVCISF